MWEQKSIINGGRTRGGRKKEKIEAKMKRTIENFEEKRMSENIEIQWKERNKRQ